MAFLLWARDRSESNAWDVWKLPNVPMHEKKIFFTTERPLENSGKIAVQTFGVLHLS